MERPELRPGDEFATRNPMALGKMINIVQQIKAYDNQSEYTHTGIIVDPHGATLEALWTVKTQNLFDAYKGQKVLIVRNIHMTLPVFIAGLAKIRPHIGQWYPIHRLLLYLIGVAKWIHWDGIVCSELAAKFETGCAEYLGDDDASGFMRNHYGVNPNHLAGRWAISRFYQTVFEGIVE